MSNIFEKYVIIYVFEKNEENLYKNLFQYCILKIFTI